MFINVIPTKSKIGVATNPTLPLQRIPENRKFKTLKIKIKSI